MYKINFPNNVDIVSYVDDLIIIIADKSKLYLENKVARIVTKIKNYLVYLLMSLNLSIYYAVGVLKLKN